MQNDDECLPSIILAGGVILVKMLINLEPLGIINQFCIPSLLAPGA